MEKVTELIGEIKAGITQTTASQKDEVRVMRAMINDKDYVVDVYGKTGVEGSFCPSAAARAMSASILAGAAKVPQAEAAALMENYEFRKSEAQHMVDISKEFVGNTYLQTGRKLDFGGHENSDIGISLKEVEGGTRTFPKQTGVDENGKAIYGHGETYVPGYQTLKIHGSCPTWKK